MSCETTTRMAHDGKPALPSVSCGKAQNNSWGYGYLYATISSIQLGRCLLPMLNHAIKIMLDLKSNLNLANSPAPSTWPRHASKLDDAKPPAPGAAPLGSPAIWHVSRGLPQSTSWDPPKWKWELKPMCNKVSAEVLWERHHNFPALHGHASLATTSSMEPSGNAPRAAACNCR